MIRVPSILLVVIFFAFTKQVNASSPVYGNVYVDYARTEYGLVLQNIAVEKLRISRQYRDADYRVLNLIDSVAEFIVSQPISSEEKSSYFQRLYIFLKNINRSYSASHFKSGTYLAVLSYYPVLIEWDQQGELQRNIQRFSQFSIKAIRLVPNDTVAEEYLVDYMLDQPDEIFRNAEEFDDRQFALRVLEKAAKLAPETAKQYFATTNKVNDLLTSSKDPWVKKAYQIFDQYGMRSHAYLLLDEIINQGMTVEQADSFCSEKGVLFNHLISLTSNPEAYINQSMLRYFHYYCTDVVRSANEAVVEKSDLNQLFNEYNTQEKFVIAAYGHSQAMPAVIRNLLSNIESELHGGKVNSIMIRSLDNDVLKDLIIYSDKHDMLALFFNILDDNTKEYILGLTSEPVKENPFPILKSFTTKIVANSKLSSKPLSASAITSKPAETKLPEKKDTISKATVTAVLLSKDTLATQVASIQKEVKEEPVEPVKPIVLSLDEKTRTVVSLKKNIVQTIQTINSFIEQDYAESLLVYAAEKEPDELLKKVDDFKMKRYSKSILEKCARNAPVSLKRYLYDPQQPINYILQKSSDVVVQKIFEINKKIGYHSKPLLLLDEVVAGNMTSEQALEISANSYKLFTTMTRILSRKKYLGKYSLEREMRDYSLRFVREINDKIATGVGQPFYSVELFNSENLYFLMLYGRDEVFASTFNGLFNMFIAKLPSKDGEAFLRSVNYNEFRDFLSLCSGYNKVDKFLQCFTVEQQKDLLQRYISGLEMAKDDLSSVVFIAEAVSNISDPTVLAFIQKSVKNEYDRVTTSGDQFGISIYGILSSMLSDRATVETKWYRAVASQFQISPVGSLNYSSLLDKDKACIQQMYFYNDDDGRSSFVNFVNTYRNRNDWAIEDRKTFVRIYSTKGVRVEVFANKPDNEENGVTAIAAFMKEHSVSPSVIIHRGHSFHTEATLQKVPASAKLVFIGSCGGFYKISMALENAPDAQIISTKQVGTMLINDMMLYALNENIVSAKDIQWNDFWDRMRERLNGNQYFSDYIPPNKNLEAIFIRAYYKILGV